MENKKSWEKFIKATEAAASEKALDGFFRLYFTDDEVAMLCLRYEIVSALLAGKDSQREISKKLGISISKITRGSNELKRISPELREFLLKEQVKES